MSQDQSVLITGSSSGFGFLMTRTLLENGHTVYASMRNLSGKNSGKADELKEAAQEKSGTLHFVELDVTDDASVEKAVNGILSDGGQIDVVVNNAGYGSGGYTEGFTSDQVHRIFDVNVYGVHRVNRAVLPSMRERGSGLLIHISSVMGRIVLPFAALYTASKYALEGYAESLRYELSGTGVDSVIIQPGGFMTGFLGNMDQPSDAARIESYGALKDVPDQFWGGLGQALQSDDTPDPQEVADAVLKYVQTPAGERPLRTVVDPLSGGEGPTAILSLIHI